MISEKTINEVFDTARIEDVVTDYMNLKKRGANMIGLCPFHNEKTPSFMVSPSKNIFKCFGCGRGGGSVQFLMEHEKYTYPEAIRHLARKYNIPIEETRMSEEAEQEHRERESLHLVNQFAMEYFTDMFWDSSQGKTVAQSYLKERGFLESTIRKFNIGYAPTGTDALKKKAIASSISEERMKTLGLVTKNGYDFFRDRIIFPIHNMSGKVIGFGGRTLKPGPKTPKYLNSPESTVYNKRRVLYGMHLAKHEIRRSDRAYLVEGYTDVISMFQSGIENVVATSGTALTSDQIKAIKRFTDNITVVYDGDEAGVKAAMRGLDMMLDEDANVRLVMLPEGKDPDTMISTHGASAFKEFLEERAEDFILFKTRILIGESKTDPVMRTRVIKDIVQSIAHIPDAIKRQMYVQQCALELDVDEQLLIREVNSAINAKLKKTRFREQRGNRDYEHRELARQVDKAAPPPSVKEVQHSDKAKELSIVRILIQFGHLEHPEHEGINMAQYVISNISDVIDTFKTPAFIKIVAMYLDGLEDGTVPASESLLNHEDQGVAQAALEIIAPEYEYSKNWEDLKSLPLLTQKMPEENFLNDCDDSILRFKQSKIHLKIAENKALIKNYEQSGDMEKLAMHIKIHTELLQIKATIEDNLNTVGIRL